MRLARRYLVSGRVQGVGFRFFVSDAAGREGLHGWVRNLPDGTVEASAEGDREALDRFELRLRQGSRLSRVDSVAVSETAASGHDTGFSIT